MEIKLIIKTPEVTAMLNTTPTPLFSHLKGNNSEERISFATLQASSLLYLWNKGHVKGLYQLCSAYQHLSQNSLWAGLSQLVM